MSAAQMWMCCRLTPEVVCRYYLNTFQDGRKQDAVDLATGAFEVPKPKGEGWLWHHATSSAVHLETLGKTDIV